MAKSSPIPLLLVRSGRSTWDQDERIQGRADMPLCDDADAQIHADLEAFRAASVEVPLIGTVHCAPDEGSLATARHVASMLGGRVKLNETLRSLDLGVWEGLKERDCRERYPKAFGQWRDDPASVRPPEGETFIETEVALLGALARATDRQTAKMPCFVLRPLEFGLARCLLLARPTSELWMLVEDGPRVEQHAVARGALRKLLEPRKARA